MQNKWKLLIQCIKQLVELIAMGYGDDGVIPWRTWWLDGTYMFRGGMFLVGGQPMVRVIAFMTGLCGLLGVSDWPVWSRMLDRMVLWSDSARLFLCSCPFSLWHNAQQSTSYMIFALALPWYSFTLPHSSSQCHTYYAFATSSCSITRK